MNRDQPKILIVEDEMILAADMQERLEEMGYRVCGHVSRGEEAVAAARSRRPDLILMDIKLDGPIDGISAAQEINREMEVPIIYLTAFTDDEILRRAKDTSPFGYLVKPLNPRELRSTVEIVLYKASMERQLRQANQELQKALAEVKRLSGLLPVCSNCKCIRDDEGYWRQIEQYIEEHSEAQFTHSICPDCARELYPEYYEKKPK